MSLHISKTFTSKKGEEIVIRTPQRKDLDEILLYVNMISAENTYLLMSGEVITREEEERYLQQILADIQNGDRFQLFAFSKNRLIANVDIHRVTKYRKRSLHIAELSISVTQNYRGQGIGKVLLEELISQAKKMGFRMLILDAFGENTRAISLYEKIGFKHAGQIPEAILYKNAYMSRVFMYLPLV